MPRGGLPRFSRARGGLIKRSKFLDGTYKAYYGPGQWPFGTPDTSGYVVPNNWNPVGTLLRVPQMVCFSFAIFPDEIDFDIAYENGPFDYLAMAAEVKKQIESLRKGLTFVDVVTWTAAYHANPPFFWLGGNPYPNNYPESTFTDPYLNPSSAIPYVPTYTYLYAPDPNEKFFGTNFLHLYATTFQQGGGSTPTNPSSTDPYYMVGKNRITGSYNLFDGFNVRMYTCKNMLNGVQDGPPVAPVKAICNDLSNYGYVYGGDAVSEMTIPNMVKLIADHFHFSSSTGRDL